MRKDNQHTGSTFDSWLDEKDIREEAAAAAVKSLVTMLLGQDLKKGRNKQS